MSEISYASYRDYRGHLIERIVTPVLRRQRFAVWKDSQRLGIFRNTGQAEQFIHRANDAVDGS